MALTNRDPGDESVGAIYRRENVQIRTWHDAVEEARSVLRAGLDADRAIAERDALLAAIEAAIVAVRECAPDGVPIGWSACWDVPGRDAFAAAWADRVTAATEAEALALFLCRERDRAAARLAGEGEHR